MPFDDDPSISGDENLLRRIPSSWIDWDENGNPNISSAAFKDEHLSVYLESVMVREGRAPAEAIRNSAGYGLAAITAAHARALNQRVARDPLPEEPARHRLRSKKTGRHRRRIARWSFLASCAGPGGARAII